MSRPDHWREFDGEARRGGARVGLIVLIVAIVVALLSAGAWGIRVATAPIKGAGDQRIQTQGDAGYRIAAYDEFYDLCGSIQAAEDRIALAQDNVENATTEGEQGRARQDLTAIRSIRVGLIREYNADASKAGTRGDFRADNLPYSIDPNQETTTCAR